MVALQEGVLVNCIKIYVYSINSISQGVGSRLQKHPLFNGHRSRERCNVSFVAEPGDLSLTCKKLLLYLGPALSKFPEGPNTLLAAKLRKVTLKKKKKTIAGNKSLKYLGRGINPQH